MSTVIKVENLSKRYRLGVINRDMLYRDLQSRWARFRGKEDPNASIGLTHEQRLEHGDEFWALRNVDLEVKEGEIVGIIGRNGAGKSTLLKILSLITAPTEGRIKVKGRIASLLEVGTGFHPELTGRENVFLNGAILGMTRKEIRSKFDQIVDFADIHEFIDTPVKRYSSGMYVRLAFAVAAHLEPEILIVDEVLAVGDMDFQKKCLGRMEEVSQKGRTVLFVSHNMPMISSLCSQCVLLDSGKLVAKGATGEILPLYHGASFTAPTRTVAHGVGARLNRIELLSAWATNGDGVLTDKLSLFDEIQLHLRYTITKDLQEAVIPFFHVLDEQGKHVFLTFPHNWSGNAGRKKGRYEAVCRIPSHFLNDGAYSVTVQVNTVANGHKLEIFEHHAFRFVVLDNIHANPHRAHTKYSYQLPGAVRPLLDWRLIQTDDHLPSNPI